jgi:hypothetical protein
LETDVWVAARLLKPLDNPQPKSVTVFASMEVLELAKERSWLAKVTNARLMANAREHDHACR